MLAYGQTGSGKTFTISGILDRIAYDLFKERDPVAIKIYFSLFELLGNQVRQWGSKSHCVKTNFIVEWYTSDDVLESVGQCSRIR